jgi:segregation and condensation protein A
MFAHHHVQRERLSVRQRMSDILSSLRESAFVDFTRLFRAEEGRMGVTVTFSAILELMKEGLIEIVQAEPYAPLHVRPASGGRHLTVVGDDGEADSVVDAENEAALAQPAYPDENDIDDDDEVEQLLTADEPIVAGAETVDEAAPVVGDSMSEDAPEPSSESPAADTVTSDTSDIDNEDVADETEPKPVTRDSHEE